MDDETDDAADAVRGLALLDERYAILLQLGKAMSDMRWQCMKLFALESSAVEDERNQECLEYSAALADVNRIQAMRVNELKDNARQALERYGKEEKDA